MSKGNMWSREDKNVAVRWMWQTSLTEILLLVTTVMAAAP